MTLAGKPIFEDEGTPAEGEHPVGKPSLVLLLLGIVAIVSPAFFTVSFLVTGLGVAAGIAAVLLARRELGRGRRGAVLVWATALGAIGIVVDVVLVTVAIVVVTTSGPVDVRVEAYGGDRFTVEYGLGDQVTTEEWSIDGWKTAATHESSAVITVTPQSEPSDGIAVEHGCRILWAGEVVAEESSDSGEVTCRYEK